MILQEPGHFVVAKGIDESGKFRINDPFYDKSSLSEYADTSLTMKRFIPANSDLSYIVVATQDNINVVLKNASETEVGTHTTEYPIMNPETGTENGNPAKFIYFSKPTSGDYNIAVTADSLTNYEIRILTYDSDGQHEKFVFSGIVGPSDTDNYSIQFNKEDSDNSSSSQNITFESFISDIIALRETGDINNLGVYLSLLTEAKVAKKLSDYDGTKKASIKILKAMQKQITKQKGKGVSENAFNILNNDIQALIEDLS